MKSEGVVFIILRKSFSVFSVWSVDFFGAPTFLRFLTLLRKMHYAWCKLC